MVLGVKKLNQWLKCSDVEIWLKVKPQEHIYNNINVAQPHMYSIIMKLKNAKNSYLEEWSLLSSIISDNN